MEELIAKIKELRDALEEPDYEVEYWGSGNFDDAYEIGVSNGLLEGKSAAYDKVLKLLEA